MIPTWTDATSILFGYCIGNGSILLYSWIDDHLRHHYTEAEPLPLSTKWMGQSQAIFYDKSLIQDWKSKRG